jgi:hypothetical protein
MGQEYDAVMKPIRPISPLPESTAWELMTGALGVPEEIAAREIKSRSSNGLRIYEWVRRNHRNRYVPSDVYALVVGHE